MYQDKQELLNHLMSLYSPQDTTVLLTVIENLLSYLSPEDLTELVNNDGGLEIPADWAKAREQADYYPDFM